MSASVTGTWWKSLLWAVALLPFLLGGCGRTSGPGEARPRSGEVAGPTAQTAGVPTATEGQDNEAEIQAARAELSPEDRRLVAAQEFCAVMSDKRLGVMGPPLKVMVNDQPVFLCCKGCQRKALADPDKTLAKVEELKAKVRAASPKQ
jgi:hypothetical protein